MGEFDQRVDLPALDFQKLNIGPYSNNVYVLTCKATKECVIIDTSHSAEPILAACEGATPKYILQTHCHGDHIDALDEGAKPHGRAPGPARRGRQGVRHQPGFHHRGRAKR